MGKWYRDFKKRALSTNQKYPRISRYDIQLYESQVRKIIMTAFRRHNRNICRK